MSFSNVLLNYHIFGGLPVIFLLLISKVILLWSESRCTMICSFKFIKVWFMAQIVVYPSECYLELENGLDEVVCRGQLYPVV